MSRISHRIGWISLVVPLLLGAATAPAMAAGTPVTLRGVYAGPVDPGTEQMVPVYDADLGDDVPTYPGGKCATAPLSAAGSPVRNVVPAVATAGGSTDQCIAFYLPRNTAPDGDDPRSLTVDLPRGFQAEPSASVSCSTAQFGINADGTVPEWGASVDTSTMANTCPSGSQVGQARLAVALGTLALNEEATIAPVYNLEPSANELARLGIEVTVGALAAPTRVVIRFVMSGSGPDARLRAVVADMPREASVLTGSDVVRPASRAPLMISGVGILAWGSRADRPLLHGPFFAQHGTECGVDLDATFSLTSYDGAESTMRSAPYQVSGCGSLPFAPTVGVSGIERRPGVTTPATVRVEVPQAAAPPRTALLRDVAVTLPPGLEVGAQVASGGGLPLCTAAQFGRGDLSAPSCPTGSRVGDVTIISPLLARPLTGAIHLGPQPAVGELPALYVDVANAGATAPDAPRIKLVGTVQAGAGGTLTTTFADNPQFRVSLIELRFDGGDHALFTTPRQCGTTTGGYRLTPSDGGPAATGSIPLTIDAGCDTPGFAASVAVTAANPQAGASSPTQITIERPDRSPWLDDVKVSLPSGFLADLHVPAECAAAAAGRGDCPPASRIATVTTLVGAGAAPLALTGSMYLVERPVGAVAGAVIVVRAKIGAIDLGDVIVPGRIELRPTDAGLDFSSDLPTRFKGLGLNLRKVVVDLDRQGFALNPTACGPTGYSAVAVGDGGQTANSSGAVSYSGCGDLAFKPTLEAKLTGDVKPGGHPGMWVELTNRAGDSNLKSANVVLPQGVAADLKNVQSPCVRGAFDAGSCPATTKVGSVVAQVSITDEAIAGDVYLVRLPGEALPGLGLSFTGRFTQRVMSVVKVNPQGRLVTRFDAIPDLPLRKLTLDITSGPKGPLQLPSGECAANTRWDATFTGQGGQTAADETGLRCADRSTVRLSDRGGLTLRNFDFGGRNLRSAKVSLPAGWSIDPARAKRGPHSWARVTGSSVKRTFTKRSITVRANGQTASTLRLKVAGMAIAKHSTSRQAKTVAVGVRFAFTDGAVQTQTIRVKAR